MNEIMKLAQKIVPEAVDLLNKRYNILRTIYYNQPIGRRILANKLGVGERIVRSEINFFKEENLIEINTPGMTITKDGEEIIEKLKDFIHEIKGLSDIEKVIKEKLSLKDVIIVPGDVDEDATVITEIGKSASIFLKNLFRDNCIIAITGGSTVKSVIDNIHKTPNLNNVLVIPARGGMGRSVEIQANNLAASFAKKLNGNYKLLHIPDNISSTALNSLLNEKEVKEIVKNIRNSDILIYGIGKADEMAARRELPPDKISELKSKGAVGEAFGYYFDRNGNVICATSSIVVDGKSLKAIENLVAVAAGKSKAEAIVATQRNITNSTLITDEGAALEIINILNKLE
ncbi:sugar-binding transcriptional regulator [Candidatus Clostridium radicumherbarum]|uniref:Sugar-binding transcriptional regulator n=1 Tax=Candidatus Clostridium radicumherbarum TaxID=3381662 RepID=A0ABW8TUC4_9CLOT